MKIGIIGAGNIGGTLARRLAALKHQVSVANSRGPESLAAFARETGARAVTVEEAARAGDVVIISIPLKSIARLPHDLFKGVPDSVVVVDTGNYYPRQRDGRIDPIERGVTETRWVADHMDHVERSLAHTPMGRAATPDDIADAVVFLALDNALITGQVLVVDGGRTM